MVAASKRIVNQYSSFSNEEKAFNVLLRFIASSSGATNPRNIAPAKLCWMMDRLGRVTRSAGTTGGPIYAVRRHICRVSQSVRTSG